MKIVRWTPNFIKVVVLLFAVLFLFSCNSNEDELFGYVEGEYTYVATNANGLLKELLVTRGQEVTEGELLYTLDPEPEASSVKAAQASIINLKSQLDFYKLQLVRQKNMYRSNATSKMELERAQASYDSYLQQLAASQAQLIQTQWSLSQKTVSAPVSGQVVDTYYLTGENIVAFKPVLTILNPENIQIIFYISEPKLSTIKIGQNINVRCDNCPKASQATISYISPEAKYTPPIIYSNDTRAQLMYLIRARLPKDIAKQFHPGQPIDVDLL